MTARVTCWLLFALAALPLTAQEPTPSGAVTPTVSLRIRTEAWNWFGADAGDDYAYTHLLLRAGLEQQRHRFGWRIESARRW